MRKNIRLFCGIISAWACLPDEKGIYNKFAAQISEFTPSVSQTSQPDPGAESTIHSAQVDKGRRKIRQECVRCVCLYSCVCVCVCACWCQRMGATVKNNEAET
jgi:hypothetical protein